MRIFCTWIQKTPPWESSLWQAEEGGLACLEAENLGIRLEGCWWTRVGEGGREATVCYARLAGSSLNSSSACCMGAHCQLIHEMIPLGTKQSFDRLSNLIMVFLFTWQIPGISSRERSGAQGVQIRVLCNPANLLTWHKVNAPFNWHLIPASSHRISANIPS